MNKIEFDFNKKNEIPYVKINGEPTAYEKIDDSFKDFIDKGARFVFEKVAEEITERKNYERAMEFTKGIGKFLRENGVTPIISEIEDTKMTENAIGVTCTVHFEGLDFSEHDRAKDDEIKQCKSDFCKLEKQLEEIKQTLKENHVFLLGIGKGAYAVDFSEHDKQFNDKIDEIIEINSGLCCQIRKLENDIETLKNTIRLLVREEVNHD